MASIKNTGATVYVGTAFSDYFADGGSGAQTMIGGLGDDFYFIDSVSDVIIENNGKTEGIDTVQTNATGLGGYVLADNVENLILIANATGSYTGNASDNKIDSAFSAATSLYGGAGADTLLGSGSNNTLDGGLGKDSMAGGAGADTYYVDDVGDKIVEDTVTGSDSVYTTVSYTLAANVEQLYLQGNALSGTGNASNNSIVGNYGNNTLLGLAGNDNLYGSNGIDKLDGGDGNDYLDGGSGDDLLIGGAGNDAIYGYAGNDKLDGGAGNDGLYGGVGNDQLIAGAGSDYLYGESGDDKLEGGDGSDFLQDGDGNDTVLGGNGNDFLVTEKAGKDTLDGGAGNDILVIKGLASDIDLSTKTLIGGAGDDVYYVQSVLSAKNVKITEAANGGNDTVRLTSGGNTFGKTVESADWGAGTATVTAINTPLIATEVKMFTLGANIENLLADLSASSKYLIGNSLNNLIVGTASVDVLRGEAGNDTLDGGSGADNLIGGAGNDLYVVDNTSDTIYEENTAAGGIDTVLSSATFRLNNGLENLSLMGTSNINGLGNAVANTIIGNAVNNLIDGAAGNDSLNGGAGADTLYGGLGTDTLDGGLGDDLLLGGLGADVYYVDSPSDIAIDVAGGEATDKVISSNSYQLGANSNIEILELTQSAGNAYAYGNSLANLITANDGNNGLSDGYVYDFVTDVYSGGNKDTLNGGKGDDIYSVVWDSDGKDTIVDSAGNDSLYLFVDGGVASDSTFTTMTLGSAELSAIENLYIIGTHTGSMTFTGFKITGSAVANIISGSNLNDTIDGGAGNDSLSGGNGDDSILGGLGNDTLEASAGNDTLNGAAGDDVYFLDTTNTGNVVVEAAGGGTDTIYIDNLASLDLTSVGMGSSNVENAVFSAYLNGISVTGTSTANVLQLTGNANLYTVAISGGAGNDTYILGDAHNSSSIDSTKVTITDTDGVDNVISYISNVTLAAGVENLTLGTVTDINTGLATGYGQNGTGNASANKITGNDAGNYIDGGAGSDTMEGGLGDDYYVVDVAGLTGDQVKELANGGHDGVYFASTNDGDTYTLADNIEYGYIYSSKNINITGNGLDNYIYDSSGDNKLDGGAGNDNLYAIYGAVTNDTLIGGLGDDIFTTNQAGTVITENAGGGNDTVEYTGSAAFTLAANIETLHFTDSASGVTLTGNASANLIYIDSNTNAAQTIDGGGGADTMAAGSGSDIYLVDSADDVVIEMDTATGTDSITLNGSAFNMASNAMHVENLTMTATDVAGTDPVVLVGNSLGNNINASADVSDKFTIYAGGGGDTVTGSALADFIDGEEGADSILGGNGADTIYGGLGADTMDGESGADVFVFTDVTGGIDTIQNYVHGVDKLMFSQSVFDQFGDSVIAADVGTFASGSAETWAAGTYLSFDTTTGKLYYDADTDTGSQFAKVQIAVFTGFSGGTFDFTDVALLP